MIGNALHLCLFTFLITATTYAQSITKADQSKYYDDAVQLAARLTSGSNSAEIPQHLIFTIEDMLVKIANHDSKKSSVVTGQYDIHTFQFVNTHEVHVYAESAIKWVKEIEEGKEKLSNKPLQRVLERYNLKVETLSGANALSTVVFSSENPINIRFIASELSMIDGVMLTEIPAPEGDGNDIQVKQVQGGWVFTYYHKYNNCESGCTNKYYWQFGVSEAGEVNFLGEYGTQLPPNYKTEEEGLLGKKD